MSRKKQVKKTDPFWLLMMVVLTLFTVLLLVDRNRYAMLVAVGIAICYILYRNPIGTRE